MYIVSSKHSPCFHDSDTSRSFTLLDSLRLQSVSRSRYHSSIKENVKRLTDSVDQSVSSRNRVPLPPNFPTNILPPPQSSVRFVLHVRKILRKYRATTRRTGYRTRISSSTLFHSSPSSPFLQIHVARSRPTLLSLKIDLVGTDTISRWD